MPLVSINSNTTIKPFTLSSALQTPFGCFVFGGTAAPPPFGKVRFEGKNKRTPSVAGLLLRQTQKPRKSRPPAAHAQLSPRRALSHRPTEHGPIPDTYVCLFVGGNPFQVGLKGTWKQSFCGGPLKQTRPYRFSTLQLARTAGTCGS